MVWRCATVSDPQTDGSLGMVGILLAAGQGTRFGGDKCQALLADGTALGVRAAQNLAGAVDHLLCVVRPDDQALTALFQAQGFRTVTCADAARGMSASLQAGIRAADTADAWVIALADMPLIKPATCQQLVAALRLEGGIVQPVFASQRGHPVGFAAKYRAELLALTGDQGARALLNRYAGQVQYLPVEDAGVLQDIDRPEDLQLVYTAVASE